MGNDKAISGLQDEIHVGNLFNDNIFAGPTVLYRVLRDFLLIKGYKYELYPATSKLSYGGAKSCFPDPSDRDYAIFHLKALREGNPAVPMTQTTKPYWSNYTLKDNETNLAYNIAQKLKKPSDIFLENLVKI